MTPATHRQAHCQARACWNDYNLKTPAMLKQQCQKQISRLAGYSYWWRKVQTVARICPYDTTGCNAKTQKPTFRMTPATHRQAHCQACACWNDYNIFEATSNAETATSKANLVVWLATATGDVKFELLLAFARITQQVAMLKITN
jgi:hypothetical protein